MDPSGPGSAPVNPDPDFSLGAASGPREASEAGHAKRRRAPIACRRCRRMRSKCLHDGAQPPCKPCIEAGLGVEDCVFPVRGEPDNDREYRHPRTRAVRTAKQDIAKARHAVLDGRLARATGDSTPADEWPTLPPLEELIDGVNRFTRYYFQLGFIHKKQYPEQLRRNHRSADVFLLLSILGISARLSPPLIARYGGGIEAAKHFIDRAAGLALDEIYKMPSLERCQAFYLLSVAQQGSGDINRSCINMGISLRMATLMRLHREETYRSHKINPQLSIRAESARRTLWMLHSQDSLHSGPLSPVSLAAGDITALLPCDEEDFASGREPPSRAALHDTPPAREKPFLIHGPDRSLFASLLQVHHFWGIVGRRSMSFAGTSRPWEPASDFVSMLHKLGEWERGLPPGHQWSHEAFTAHRAKGQHLAYLGVTMMPRMCNIILRRPYLNDLINLGSKDSTQQAFFAGLSHDLFRNVRDLFEQVDAQFTSRDPGDSVGAQMASFCVYTCGLFSAYLCKYPHFYSQDPSLARLGPAMLQRTSSILRECKEVWPLAARWVESLDRFTVDPHSALLSGEATMADGREPVPHPVRQVPQLEDESCQHSSPTSESMKAGGSLGSSSQHSTVRSLQGEAISPDAGMSGADGNPLVPQFSAPVPGILPAQPTSSHPQGPLSMHFRGRFAAPHMYAQTASPPSLARPPTGQDMLVQALGSTSSGILAQGYGSQPQGLESPMAPLSVNTNVDSAPGLNPSTDGFDGELQFYFDGANTWAPPSDWMGGLWSEQ